MDEEQLRILIAASETASGPLGTVTGASVMLKNELTELHAIMQQFGKKTNYDNFDRGMKAMQARMASMQGQAESLRQQYISLNRTVSSSGGVAERAAEKHANASNIIRSSARGVPTYSTGKMDPKGIKETEQATDKLSKAQRRNTQVTQQQGRMFGFAAREVHGLRLGFLGTAVSAAFFSKLIVDSAVNTANLGEEIMNVGRSFDITFEGEFRSGIEQLNLMREASKGLATDLDLMKTAVFVAQFPFENLKLLLPEIIEASTNLALAQGKDIPQSIDDMVRALGRGSSKILDNLGIILKVEQAHKEYARQLGKTVQQLTEREKAEAFAVIGTQRLIEKGAEYEGMNKEVEASIVGLENAWNDFAVEFAKFSVDPLSDAIDFIRDFTRGSEQALKSWSGLVHYMSIFERLQDTIDFYRHGAYGDQLQKQIKNQREQQRLSTLSDRFQADPSSTFYEKAKDDERILKEGAKRASTTAESPYFRSGTSFGVRSPEQEDPKIVEEREKAERARSRTLASLSRLAQSQTLRELENLDTAKQYIDQNQKPDYDPLQRAKDAIGYDPSKDMEEQLNKTAKRMESGLKLLVERWDTAQKTVDDANKERERSAEKSKDLDDKILGLKSDILEAERSYNADIKEELLSEDIDSARSFIGQDSFRRRMGDFDKTPVQIATERAEDKITGASTQQEKVEALNFLKSELDKEIKIRNDYLRQLDTAQKTVIRYEKDKSDEQAKIRKEDIDFYKRYDRERKEIDRQIQQEQEEAYQSLADGTYKLAEVLESESLKLIAAGSNIFNLIQQIKSFQSIGGTAGFLGSVGIGASIAASLPDIARTIGSALEGPASKMDRAANKMLQSSSDFAKSILADDPDYQRLRKESIAPIITEVERLLSANEGDRFTALTNFLTKVNYGIETTKVKYAGDSNIPRGQDPFANFFGENLDKDLLKSLFGPETTFADLKKESIRLSDAFKILTDEVNSQNQSINDQKDVERTRLRGIAASEIRDAGSNFVERNRIVEQLRKDLEQVRLQEEGRGDSGQHTGTTSGVTVGDPVTQPDVSVIEAPVTVTPELDPNEGMEFIDSVLKSLKDSIDKSLGFVRPILVAVDALIESKEEGSTSRLMLEKLREDLQFGIDHIEPIKTKLDDLIVNKGDGTDVLETLDALRIELESGLKLFEPASTTLDNIIKSDETDSSTKGILTGLKTSLILGLELFEPIVTAMDRLVKTDPEGIGVDTILTDLHTQLTEKLQLFTPVLAGIEWLIHTETDIGSRMVLSNFRTGLSDALEEFNPVLSDIQELLTVSAPTLSSTFALIIETSMIGGIAQTGNQTFDLSAKINVHGGDLDSQISSVIDEAVSSALDNSRRGNPDTFEDTYGYPDPVDNLDRALENDGIGYNVADSRHPSNPRNYNNIYSPGGRGGF